ncbi:MAG: NUDIX hydrolase [Anaerolineae bacterium]
MQPEDQGQPDERGDSYTVVPRTLIFLTRDDEVLLLKGAANKRLWANKWNGIGGHVESDESPYRSAMRELKEETGLTPEELRLRAVVHITLPEPPGVVLFVFLGSADGEPTASDEGQPVWVDRDRLFSLPLVEDLEALLPRVLEPGPVVFAHYTITPEGLQITFD